MRVSFDFDGTLTKPMTQAYASELVKRGVEVWICTARYDDKEAGNDYQNKDLYKIADRIGISRAHIMYMNMTPKWRFFRDRPEFVWHLDDDRYELEGIKQNTVVRPISVFGNSSWIAACERHLNQRSG